MGWAIAVQGGAGDIPVTLAAERREPCEAAMRHCLKIGVDALKAQKSPLDVVELVVRKPNVSLSLSLYIYIINITFLHIILLHRCKLVHVLSCFIYLFF